MPWPKDAGARRKLRRLLFRILAWPMVMVGVWFLARAGIDLLIAYASDGKLVFSSPWRIPVGSALVVAGFAMGLLGSWGGRRHVGGLHAGVARGDGLIQDRTMDAMEVPCPRCLYQNEPGARLCLGCGSVLITSWECPNCRRENDLNASLCDNCGQAVSGGRRAG